MKNTQSTGSGSGVYRRDNEYAMSRRDMSTPYFQAYCAARSQQPTSTGVKMSPVYGANPRPQAYNQPMSSAPDYSEPAVAASKRSTGGSTKKARRGFFVFLIMLFMLLFIAVAVLNYLSLEPLESINGYTSLFDKVAPSTEEEDKIEVVKRIGIEDIVMSFVGNFLNKPEEEPTIDTTEYAFYNECMAKLDEVETLSKIAYYALPIVLALSLIIAVIFFIRALVALCTNKRRKLFVLTSIIMLVLSLVGIVCGFIWSGAEWGDIMNFTPFGDGSIGMQVGYGYIILAGISLLTFIASLFAFRSKKSLS